MADWRDVLDDIAGGAAGVVQGVTKGADPFLAWDRVATSGQNVQKGELQLRDLQQMQDALENPDLNYYGNAAAARNTGNLKSIASGNLDIFNNQNQLDLVQALSDPNGYFQITARAKGLTPGSPEYRQFLADYIAQSNPTAGVAAYDKYNIAGLQQQNLNEQATLKFIESWARQQDPNARVVRKPDGTIAIIGSDGQETEVPSDVYVKVAAMLKAQTPYSAISQGLKDEGAIQQVNINLLKALRSGQMTPAQAVTTLEGQRKALTGLLQDNQRRAAAVFKSPEFQQMEPAEQEAIRTQFAQERQQLIDQMNVVIRTHQYVAATNRVPGAQLPGAPGPVPQGGAAVTTRPAPGSMAARAAGAAALPDDTYGYPPSNPTPWDTGIRPITGLEQQNSDPLGAFLQSLGVL